MPNWVQSWVRGDANWDEITATAQQWAPLLSGAVFGAGWWCFVDGLVYSKVVLQETVPATFWLPGIVATIALVLMNLVPRESLTSEEYSYDEDTLTKARCWLFMSYLVAFGAVGSAGAVFTKAVTNHVHVSMGVGCLLQSGFVLMSALLFWAFRTPRDTDYFMY
mmetsp:Transcript_16776/g.50120  ORF Transcript_16776/g.50120 Transcript_16776/m.50120 type:complete len:164 (-) Transcript_16776:508-999(-)